MIASMAAWARAKAVSTIARSPGSTGERRERASEKRSVADSSGESAAVRDKPSSAMR